MDSSSKFYEREIDRTPYSAFVWIVIFLALVFSVGSFGLWRLGKYLAVHNFLATHEVQGATDNYLQSAAAQAGNAATNLEKQAADAAQAQATQELLNQKNAAINSVTQSSQDALQQAAASAMPSASPSASATPSGEELFQQYLGQ